MFLIIIMLLFDCNAIFKMDTLNDFSTVVAPTDSDPSFTGRLDEFEDHHDGGFS